MALPAAPSMNAFHAVATAVPIVALIVTAFRLYYRIHRRLAWWDDLLIAVASFFMAILVIFIWLSTTPDLPQKLKVASYYLCTFTFTFSNYFARLSILVGILRIAPNPRTRLILKGMAALFVSIMLVLIAQKVWICDGSTTMAKTWKSETNPSCHLGLQVAITELVTDIICDAMLVITPLTFLSRSKLKPAQKRRLYAIFGASVATTITSIVQDYLILAAGGLREETASMMEVAVAIIVANLPVIISWIYRLRNQKADDTATRFATDYDHNRRAKPSAWAGSSDLVSDSNNATKHQQLTSHGQGIQLSEVRRGSVGHALGAGEDFLDLRDLRKTGRKSDPADDGLSFDDDDLSIVKKSNLEFDSEAITATRKSSDHGRFAEKGVDLTISAISFGGERRVIGDPELNVDIVDDLDEPHPLPHKSSLPQLKHHRSHSLVTAAERENEVAYAHHPYAYASDNRPYTPATPSSVSAPAYDAHSETFYAVDENEVGAYPSMPPPVLAHGLTSRSSPVTPLNSSTSHPPLPIAVPNPTLSNALVRSGSAHVVGRRFSNDGHTMAEEFRRPTQLTAQNARAQLRAQNPSEAPPTPFAGSRSGSARVVPAATVNPGNAFGGMFGGGGNNPGVLVEQHVTVVTDDDIYESERR